MLGGKEVFRYEYPIFEHKNILKKKMLDDLRDYPLFLSRMILGDRGDGILQGCGLAWEEGVLEAEPGLLCYHGDIYRMEESFAMDCVPTDRQTYIKVRFSVSDRERDYRRGVGEVYLDTNAPKEGEMELGRFRLQEGARLRTVYENFEDYRTEYDTVNRIHVPYLQPDGAGLWPQMLMAYGEELLETGTEDVYDISFAVQLLGTAGYVSAELVRRYAGMAGNGGREDNSVLYAGLLRILKERKAGRRGQRKQEGAVRQMILL